MQLESVQHPLRTLHALATATALLMLVVVATSAWLRLGAPAALRASCNDWPQCRRVVQGAPVRLAPGSASARAVDVERVARSTHRAAASAVLLLVLLSAALAMRGRRAQQRREARDLRGGCGVDVDRQPWGELRALAFALVGLALVLAVLGIFTPRSGAIAVMLGNQLGGLALLALGWALVRRSRAAPPLPLVLKRVAACAAALWLLQAALGAVSGAAAGGAGVAAPAHVMLAVLAAGSSLWLGLALRQGPRRAEGLTLCLIALTQVTLGFVAAASGAAPGVVVVHNTLAAIGTAVLAGLAFAEPA